MENVFNRVLILILLSGITVCSSAMTHSATTPMASVKSMSVPEGSNHNTIIQKPSKSVASQDVSLYLQDQQASRERNKLQHNGPWLTEKGISSNAQQLIHAIQTSTIHGLNPEAYGLSRILRTTDALVTLSSHVSESNDAHLVDVLSRDIDFLRTVLNRQLNAAFTQLSEHLGQGVVDARAVQKRMFRKSPRMNAKALLDALTTGNHNVSSALNSVVPVHPEYHRLTAKMRDLLMEHATGASRTYVQASGSLAGPQLREDAVNLQMRLIESGDLASGVEPGIDSTHALHNALRSFQSRNGIAVTGEADEQTLAALNLSIVEEIKAVALSLERWRWMPPDLGSQHILVNIPEYRLEVRSELQPVLTMDVVVGSVKYQTPAFSRDMSYMDFNPIWMVPQSIANRDLIPLERKQPGYLASRKFDILERIGEKLVRVPHDRITAADLQQERFPYILKQRGGPRNALGKVKFMMPNPYSIYLHDTPAKEHFTLDNRAFSNGCIRLSEPEQLARLLMLADGYAEQDVAVAWSSRATRRINLRTPIPTHMTYMTAWVDENNLFHRRADIYGYDEVLENALQASNTLLSTIMHPPVFSTNDITAATAALVDRI